MKKIAILSCILFVFLQTTFSNDNRKTVAVHPFSGNKEVASVLQERISNELLKLNRVILVNQRAQASYERTEAFATANTLGEFGVKMGATHVLSGIVSKADIEDKTVEKNGKKNEAWVVHLTIDLSVIDVKTGRILSSHSFSHSQREKTRKAALDKTYQNIVSRSIPFLRNSFPVEGRITEIKDITDPKKGVRVHEILINLGTRDGMKKKMVFDVFEEKTINDHGQERVLENFMGQIRIKEVKGENFSMCVISKNTEKMQQILVDHERFIVRTPMEKVR
jgi:hypothetical protein